LSIACVIAYEGVSGVGLIAEAPEATRALCDAVASIEIGELRIAAVGLRYTEAGLSANCLPEPVVGTSSHATV
jgi:hypothetical protein